MRKYVAIEGTKRGVIRSRSVFQSLSWPHERMKSVEEKVIGPNLQ